MSGYPQQRHYSGVTYDVICTELDRGPAANCHHEWLKSRDNFLMWSTVRSNLAYLYQCTEQLIEDTIRPLEEQRIKDIEERRAAEQATDKNRTRGKGKGRASGVGKGSQQKNMTRMEKVKMLAAKSRHLMVKALPISRRRTRSSWRPKKVAYVLLPHPKAIKVAYRREVRGDARVKSEEGSFAEPGVTVRRSSRPRKMTTIGMELARANKKKVSARRKPPPPPAPPRAPSPEPPEVYEPRATLSPAGLTPPISSISHTEGLRRRGTGFGTFLKSLDLEHTTAFFADYGFRTKKDVQVLKGWSDETKKTLCEWILKDRVMTVKDMGVFYESVKSKDGH